MSKLLVEWKEVFRKCWRSRRWCSKSAGGVQNVFEEQREVFKKWWRSEMKCSRNAGGETGGVQKVM